MKFKLLILQSLLTFKLSHFFIHHRLLSLSKLKRKRFKKLRKHLQKSPFYSAYASDQQTLEAFPIISKSIFMEKFDQINTVGIRREEAWNFAIEAERNRDFSGDLNRITVGLSSGTSGNFGIFLASEQERARWVASILDRVIGFSFRKRKVAFFLRADSKLYQSVRSRLLQFQFFDITMPFKEHLGKLANFQPDILVAQPSVLRSIAEAIGSKELLIEPRKIISVAEVLEPLDRIWFSQVFHMPIDEVYQCMEGFLAVSCKEGHLHFNEDFLILEKKYLDDSQTRFHPIITDLFRYSQPVIRYELDDIILEKKNCPCGQDFTAIERIEGRSDDALTLIDKSGEWVRIYPDILRRSILRASPQISQYALTQVDKEVLTCYFEYKPGKFQRKRLQEEVEKNLRGSLYIQGIEQIEIRFLETYEHQAGTKFRRIRNVFREQQTKNKN